MAMIASVTMNFPHISTHNISSNQTFSPICTNNPSNFSSSSSSSIPISSNSIRLSSSIAYSEQLIASHNVNRRTKNRKIKVISARSEPLKVMISGAPASGKGTQCELIVQKFGLVHISTGDLLRAELSAGTDIGNKAKEYMNAGRLVPDEIVTAMVTTRLSKEDAKEKGWLLDGYPRTLAQAESLERLNIRPDIYIVLDVPDAILIDRCVGRRLDPLTGKIYHVTNFPPETEDIKARLITRPDDTEEKVKSRLQIYKQNAEAILPVYSDIMNKIDGNRGKDSVFAEIDSLLSRVQKEEQDARKSEESAISSTRADMASLSKDWRGIPTRLNNIPHSREIREYFYTDVLQATQRAVNDGKTRLKIEINIPELNPSMDVYRIGTLMELIRVLALSFADDGKRVKVCVQGSMGEGALAGMPLQLAGSRKILEYMDWGDYGALGNFINIGSIGGKEVEKQDDVFILVAPQNAVGNCIIDDMRAMTDAFSPIFHFTMKLHISTLITTILISLSLVSIVQSTQPPFSCDSSNPQTKSLKFCQTGLPISVRVLDLVSRLTLDEKISQLVNSAPAIPRLGIPAYEWWSESLHGVGSAGKGIFFNGSIAGATSFPQVILTAATFDENLWYRIGQVIGVEARGVYNAGQAIGMTFWAPNINIFRDPRWGRGQETPGEDPIMTGKYAIRYVRGVQGDSFNGGQLKKGHLQASACCKHFTAYDLDQWKNLDRFSFNAIVTPQDMADTFQPPFQDCIQKAQASGIMCSYNSVNGIPSCANYNLLTKTARQQWGFHGYITSDCDAVQVMHDNHRYGNTPEDSTAFALKAGMDIDCGDYLKKYTKSAVMKKKVSQVHIDRALHNLFSIRMRLGLFNGDPRKQLYGNISPSQVCAPQHQQLALEAARNGIVLLKNTGKLLPLSKAKTNSLAVIGHNANNAYILRGNYDGPPCKYIEILKALVGYAKSVQYQQGCNAANCTSANIDQAVNIARNADYVVLIMGLDQTQEREQFDRDDLVLPGQQENLINSVAKAAKKPVILVILSGGPVDISFAKYNPKIGSILWAGYPGEAGGIALAEIIFGEHNPGGKLPVTWYPQAFVKIPMTDMRMRPDPKTGYPGRTYRFYKGPKVYEFGYGLSYTTYSYGFHSATPNTIQLNQLLSVKTVENSDSIRYTFVDEIGSDNCEKAKFSAHVSVENSGEMDGKHPVLLFVKQDKARNGSPIKQLVGFQSVSLKAGENSQLVFEISPCEHLSSANEDGLMMIEEGSRYLVVGDAEHPINIMI